ncbi:hypothetical protein ml_67 [Mollivirus sibericum]|uniref:hypothetical protein n=1 Tax=Mollivirus sibericum TaxID=1678078 RepID=UPI0006B2DF28|nr:hypothetical protein ml_67 [Mollivirus sibericum]ALD61869.1 hypothetical protein ml_67 [Mollivirus sibericum]
MAKSFYDVARIMQAGPDALAMLASRTPDARQFLLELVEASAHLPPFDLNVLAWMPGDQGQRFGRGTVAMPDPFRPAGDALVPMVVRPGFMQQGSHFVTSEADALSWLGRLRGASDSSDLLDGYLDVLDEQGPEGSDDTGRVLDMAKQTLVKAIDGAVTTRNGVALAAALSQHRELVDWTEEVLNNAASLEDSVTRASIEIRCSGSGRRSSACDRLPLGDFLSLPFSYDSLWFNLEVQAQQAGEDLDPLRLVVIEALARDRPDAFAAYWPDGASNFGYGLAGGKGRSLFHRLLIAANALVGTNYVDADSVLWLGASLSSARVRAFFGVLDFWVGEMERALEDDPQLAYRIDPQRLEVLISDLAFLLNQPGVLNSARQTGDRSRDLGSLGLCQLNLGSLEAVKLAAAMQRVSVRRLTRLLNEMVAVYSETATTPRHQVHDDDEYPDDEYQEEDDGSIESMY